MVQDIRHAKGAELKGDTAMKPLELTCATRHIMSVQRLFFIVVAAVICSVVSCLIPYHASAQENATIIKTSKSSQVFQMEVGTVSSVTPADPLNLALTCSTNTTTYFISVDATLTNSKKRQVGTAHGSINHPQDGTQLLDLTVKPYKQLDPGVYELTVKGTASTNQGPQTVERSYRIYVYNPELSSLDTSYIVRISIPPLMGVDNKPDETLIKRFAPVAEQLNRLLKGAADIGNTQLTLSVPRCTLQDWNQLASQTDRSDAGLYQDLINTLKTQSTAGSLEIVLAGYDDPDFHTLREANLTSTLSAQYSQTYLDGLRPLPDMPYKSGAVPSNLSLPAGVSTPLVEAGITWTVALNNGLALTGEQQKTPSALYASQENPKLTVLQADRRAYPLISSGDQLGYHDTIFDEAAHQADSEQVQRTLPFIAVIPLDGNSQEVDEILDALTFSSKEPWQTTVFASELAKRAKKDVVAPLAPVSQEDRSAQAQNFNDVGTEIEALRAASGGNLDAYKKAETAFIHAQSSGWSYFDHDGALAVQTLLSQADKEVSDVFHDIKISSHDVHLSGRTGEVPIIIKNDNKHELLFTIKAQSNNSLTVTNDKFLSGVTAGTLAGENYVSIPVKVTKTDTAHHTLTVEVLSGSYVVATAQIPVVSSRIDLFIVLIIALVVLLALLISLRSRLRKAGTAQKLMGPQSFDEVVEQIKEEALGDAHLAKNDNPEGPVKRAGISERFEKVHGPKGPIYVELGDEPESQQHAEQDTPPENTSEK